MLTALFLINIVSPLRELTARRLCITVQVIPVHPITMQPLFSAYLYLFAAFGLAAALLKVPKVTLYEVMHISLVKGWRACVAMGLFGAMPGWPPKIPQSWPLENPPVGNPIVPAHQT